MSLFSNSLYAKESDTEKTGDGLRIMILAVGFISTVVYEKKNDGTIQFIKAFTSSQIITEGLKSSIHKKRPNGDGDDSFPSGHTSAAFMGAGFIHNRYGLKYSIPAYAGAVFVGYSRVYADKHFIEDVAMGAVIGISMSYYFTEPYKGFTITPTVTKSSYGIILSRTW
ncbi:phosphatase PAP2 family protein [Candidatus Desantisbacteria bacterium]|nr:phosphatase PAP2 family protein [Candidatus Desantisbacteria bacterium]